MVTKKKIRVPGLHPKQEEAHYSTARFKVLACGRRFGKTRLGTAQCVRTVILQPGARLWWLAPTYKMVEPGWRALCAMTGQIQGITIRVIRFVSDTALPCPCALSGVSVQLAGHPGHFGSTSYNLPSSPGHRVHDLPDKFPNQFQGFSVGLRHGQSC